MERHRRVYRHSLAARITHWLWALAILVLVMSGLQIFNAAPYLDASDKSDPSARVLAIGAAGSDAAPVGVTTIFGRSFVTTGLLGFTDDGLGERAPRAFPAWLTLPGPQNLAEGRRWHFFFGWVLALAALGYGIAGLVRGDLRKLVLRPSDLPALWPMQLYYLRLRKRPPPYEEYNPLQKAAYTLVLFVLFPLVIVSGLALAPGVDSIAPWLTQLFGGRQFARLWHFVFMALLIGYFAVHLLLVLSTGAWNNVRAMVTGWYTSTAHPEIER
ncbi:MAG TPA: cytochrome b/b6 domain-containing protein [Candidatus Limnocylindria bacterium]|jgi:Ni/Fe-hydrogenase b-type cytochrome subunit|nr:cytochrome b/b6 domain-containing protein [Candidatus Limnocylindria bacterium]